MATTNASFIFQNNASTLDGAAFTAIPYVEAFDAQSALMLTGREQGGGSYRANSNSATKSIILLDGLETMASRLGYAKNGCFHVTTSGTTGVTIDLTNLATASTTTAGDVTFAKWNMLIFYNLSGLDGVTAAGMTIAPGASNPLGSLFTGTTPTLNLASASRVVVENTAGVTVSSSAKTILITPTAGGNFALVVCGS